MVVLSLAEEDATTKEVEHLIEALNKSVRWPVLVYNVADEISVICTHKYTSRLITLY